MINNVEKKMLDLGQIIVYYVLQKSHQLQEEEK